MDIMSNNNNDKENSSESPTKLNRTSNVRTYQRRPALEIRNRAIPDRYTGAKGKLAPLLSDWSTSPPKCAKEGPTDFVSSVSPLRPSKFYGSRDDTTPPESPTRLSRDFARGDLQRSPVKQANEIVASHLIGFPNRGLTCYINSVLQALLGLPSFNNDLLDILKESRESGSTINSGLLSNIAKLAGLKDRGKQSEIGAALDKIKTSLVKV